MRKKSWLKTFVYAIVLVGYMLLSNKFLVGLEDKAQITFNILPYVLWSKAVFVVLGFLLGLDYLYKEFNKVGLWKVRVSKLVIIGMPILIYVLVPIISFLNFQPLLSLFDSSITNLQSQFSHMNKAIEVLLGYTIITSFYKYERTYTYSYINYQ